MKVLFGYQDVLDMITDGITPLGKEATTAQEAKFKEDKKKDYKALFLIHSCVDSDNFEKVGDCDSAKTAWGILEKAYAGADKAKVVRLQTHKRQFELLQMEDKETINDYVTHVTRLGNQMKLCGEVVSEQNFVSKVLCSLTPTFDNIVVAIEESKDLKTMTKDELQSSLEAHEQRMDERGNDKAKAEVALQARFNEKNKKSKGKWPSRGKKNFQNFDGKESQNSRKGEGSSKGEGQDNYKPFDKSTKNAEKSAITHSEKSAMVTVRDGAQWRNEWYLDSGCSTYMTGRKDWFVKINQATRSRVKFTDDTTLAADGVDDVLIMRRDGGHSLIKDVMYIPGIKCNILSIGQLLERNYMIWMENKVLRVLDQNGVLILKAPMAANRTFKIELEIMEHRCLATAVWSGFKPNLSHLRVFGSVAFQHITGQLRKKLDDKSEMMLLVGYHPTGGYKLFDVSSKKIVISRDVIVDEENQNFQPAEGALQQPFRTETGESSRRPTRRRGLP
ncbi:uncharacterized protein [Cicer arietinum]|uniref:Uncharacterized protein LOC101496493 n=1 Tax=Cicer arietinum TaxID=3827 RepID=A0A1S2XL82_CICAR|nr:uncharacterized protein LOC101496493 [Cicer arietinum]